jgi:diaminopimelate epimerase
MVGAGNDFVILDSRREPLRRLRAAWPAAGRAWCDRHRGIGADGLLVLESSKAADVRMRVFNSDGSEAEMCGNGARCVALYASVMGPRGGKTVSIESRAGIVTAAVHGERVTMRLPNPTGAHLGVVVEAEGRRVSGGFINTGVPHLVVEVDDLEAVDVARLGRALRRHRRFAPIGTNVNFIRGGRRPNHLRVRTYERGVEAETLACGTGMAASAIIHALARNADSGVPARVRSGRSAQRWSIELEPRSGDPVRVSFTVDMREGAQHVRDVSLEGAARIVFTGVMSWPPRRN